MDVITSVFGNVVNITWQQIVMWLVGAVLILSMYALNSLFKDKK